MIATMVALLHSFAMFVLDCFKSPRRLEVENLFLRHQLSIALRRAPPRIRLRGSDRALLVWMTWFWPSLLGAAQVVKPETIVVPENSIRLDSRDEAESGHHLMRCLPSFTCLGPWSPACSSRSADLKSRTSFFGISSISPSGAHRAICGCVAVIEPCWRG
jgi:hypothetical protein